MKINETLSFGKYEWQVLDVNDTAALIITKYIIEERSYNDEYRAIAWADCSLRKYLNTDFLDGFSEVEKSRIITGINKTADNEWYGTEGGEDTRDTVFLLSIEDVVCRYFGDSSRLLYNPRRNQRYWFERKDANNPKRSARFEHNEWNSWWWLRSPGRVSIKAAYVHGNGDIGIQGNNVLKGNVADGRCTGGVRPVMWVRLG